MFPSDHIFYGLKRRHYRCLVLDPPTRFVGGTKGRPQHYKRMTWTQIAELPLHELAHPEGAWVFCWIGSPQVRNMFRANEGWTSKDGTEVRGWRAKFSGRAFMWVKTNKKHAKLSKDVLFYHRDGFFTGMGYTSRKNAEDCWLFKYGAPKRSSRAVKELIFSPVREHSRKPDEALDRICAYAEGPRCELFARRQQDDRFDLWGDQVGRFDE